MRDRRMEALERVDELTPECSVCREARLGHEAFDCVAGERRCPHEHRADDASQGVDTQAAPRSREANDTVAYRRFCRQGVLSGAPVS